MRIKMKPNTYYREERKCAVIYKSIHYSVSSKDIEKPT